MKITQTHKRVAALTLGSIGLLLAGVALGVGTQSSEPKNTQSKSAEVAVSDRPVSRDSRMTTSFSTVVKKVGASVVKVSTKVKANNNSRYFNDPLFRRFFGEEFGRRMTPEPQHGIGSGVIVTKDGYILTNNHVVEEADELKIELQDGRVFTARVIGKDPKSDLAVIKINANDLPRIEMTDSEKIEVGDVVLAIGNPFGIGQTVTMGIISATGRATLGLDYEDFIQTDASINPGNSGGALVDAEGRLIGINTAIVSRSGGNQGIGFAIPTNLARDIMEGLIKYGKVTRGYMGVMIQDITPALAKEFKLKDDKGALVGDVIPKGPAAKAGLKNGDVIIELNGKQVQDGRRLKLEVARIKPGTSVPVKILRDGSTKNVNVTLEELPGSEKQARDESENPGSQDSLQGVTVGDLDAEVRRQLKVPSHIQGAIVTDVDPNSSSAEAGLRQGDVITEIDHQPVRNAEDAVRLTEKPKNKATLLRVWSNGTSRYLVVDESKPE